MISKKSNTELGLINKATYSQKKEAMHVRMKSSEIFLTL